MCVQCGKWVHCRCARIKKGNTKVLKKSTCRKCEGNTGEAVEQEEKSCDEAKTVKEFTFLGDKVSAGRGCEAAVTVRTRCGWAKHRVCGEIMYGRRLPLKLKGGDYK